VKGGSTTLKETKEVKELGKSKPSDKKTRDEKRHNHEQEQDGDACKMKRGNVICKDKDERRNGMPERRGIRWRPREIQAAKPFLVVLQVPDRDLHVPIRLLERRPRG